MRAQILDSPMLRRRDSLTAIIVAASLFFIIVVIIRWVGVGNLVSGTASSIRLHLAVLDEGEMCVGDDPRDDVLLRIRRLDLRLIILQMFDFQVLIKTSFRSVRTKGQFEHKGCQEG